jgi:hypothetical protein
LIHIGPAFRKEANPRGATPRSDARGFKAVLNRAAGKGCIAFLAREALLLSCGDNFTIAQEAGSAVVIECGNAEDIHGSGWL